MTLNLVKASCPTEVQMDGGTLYLQEKGTYKSLRGDQEKNKNTFSISNRTSIFSFFKDISS